MSWDDGPTTTGNFEGQPATNGFNDFSDAHGATNGFGDSAGGYGVGGDNDDGLVRSVSPLYTYC